jgi:phenylalanyl-tRNA synthetase beta chain
MLISYNWLRELTGTGFSPQELRERLTNVGLAIDAVHERDGDYILDVEVPSNRGDCLSHVGISREVAAIGKTKFQIPDSKSERTPDSKSVITQDSESKKPRDSESKKLQDSESGKPQDSESKKLQDSEPEKTKVRASDFTSVEILDPDLCPRYAARVVRGVKIAPSPEWLAQRLEVIGQRPINNVADITNYVLHEFGQPLHAFDLAKLTERRIIVRRAAKGESIKTLDGETRKLDEKMLVIADAVRPVAVAGVMGGEDSEISSQTTDVLIESAWFDPSSVRRTAKLLGLHTEASHRFERGIDPEGVLRAQERCVALICELAGGIAGPDIVDVYPGRREPRVASLRPGRIESIASLLVPKSEMLRIFDALGFELTRDTGDQLLFVVPSWRHDVSIEEDLVEEVARLSGYNEIGADLPPANMSGQYHASEKRKRALRRALTAQGFDEAICLSFVEPTTDFDLIPEFAGKGDENLVTLTNPIIEEASRMRQSLLPGLLNCIRHNVNHGTRDVCLFELGRVFAMAERGHLPQEREALALVATGGLLLADRAEGARELDFFDLKGALESGIAAMNLPPFEFEAGEVRHLRPGQSARIKLNGSRVGSIGRLAQNLSESYKFRQPVLLAEVDLSALLEIEELPVLYSRLPRYPSIQRDVSLLVDRNVTFAELLQAVSSRKPSHFAGLSLVGTYEGEGIPEHKRSITFRFDYRANDRTLRDEEVEELHWPLVRSLEEQFKAEVR